MTETIDIIEGSRLRVEPDDSPSCPRGDYMTTGFVKIQGRGEHGRLDVPAVHSDPTGRIAEAYDEFNNHGFTPHTDILYRRRNEAELLVVRWARAIHGMHIEYDAVHGGYWFADPVEMTANWPELVPGSPEYMAKEGEVIAQERETYRQWADGEVYGVILERSHELYRLDEEGVPFDEPSLTDWQSVEGDSSIWGCYLDDKYTAETVALEYLSLNDEERSALTKESA